MLSLWARNLESNEMITRLKYTKTVDTMCEGGVEKSRGEGKTIRRRGTGRITIGITSRYIHYLLQYLLFHLSSLGNSYISRYSIPLNATNGAGVSPVLLNHRSAVRCLPVSSTGLLISGRWK